MGSDMSQERAAFEAWALEHRCPCDLLALGGNYTGSGLVAGLWSAWQASGAVERKRCAALVRSRDTSQHEGYIETTGDFCEALADCILKGPL